MIIMAINAYLIKQININTYNDEIIIEKIIEKNPTFSLTHHEKIFELIQKHDCDNTNEDLTGEIVIDNESWKKVIINLLSDNLTNEELKIIEKISFDLKNKSVVYYEYI